MLLALAWGLGAQKPRWVHNPLPKQGAERSPGCLLGLPATPAVPEMLTAEWAYLEPHPTILPPSQRTAWLGLELLSPLPPLFPGRDGWGEVGNSGEVVMQLVAVGRETSLVLGAWG